MGNNLPGEKKREVKEYPDDHNTALIVTYSVTRPGENVGGFDFQIGDIMGRLFF